MGRSKRTEQGTDLAHGTEEGLHPSACESPCGGRLQEDCAECDRGAICDVEGDQSLNPGEDEVKRSVLASAYEQLSVGAPDQG